MTISLQLYSLRNQLNDLDDVLSRISSLGITAVEPFSLFDKLEELIPALARHGLTAPTAHAPFLSDDIEYAGRRVPLPPLAITLGAAKALGVSALFDPMVPAERWLTASEVEATADRLNAAALEAASVGMRVGYHNHSFEFHHHIGNRSAYEHFVSLLHPDVVLEVDVYWAAMAGQDVPALLERLGDRVIALHLKDGASVRDPFAADGYDAESLDQLPLGDGVLDIKAILNAAPANRLDVIEFDRALGNRFEEIAASLAYLRERP